MSDQVDKLPRTLAELLQNSVALYGERTALIDDGRRLSYSDLAGLVDSYARSLVALGVSKGSRVGLLMENRTEWVAFAFAATGLGALFVPISTFSMRDDLAFQLRHADISHLFLKSRFLKNNYLDSLIDIVPEIDESMPGALYSGALPALRRVVVHGAEKLPRGASSWDSFVAAGASVPEDVIAGLRVEVDPEDECYLLYTSGTTAKPKGVLQVHGAIARNGQLIGDYQELTCKDVVWFYFPMFFSAGCINVMLGTLSHGAALILQAAFEPAKALELMEQEQANTWHLWPHTLKQLQDHPDWSKRDLSRLHKGTGPWDLLIDNGVEGGEIGGVNMYGMTETCTAFACSFASDSAEVRLETQGFVMPGSEIKIIDPDNSRVMERGEPGEICVKGPSVMRRYYKLDPSGFFDAEGFFHTGDLGLLDQDGRLRFQQRLKDMIKTGGINVSPAEIEAKLNELEGVEGSYAFPLPSGEKGEVVGAALVVKEGKTLSDEVIESHCRKTLPGFKRPVGMLVLTAEKVPMTGTGKVQKVVLAERLQAALKQADRAIVRH